MDVGFDFIHQFAGISGILDGFGIFFAKYAAYLFVLCFVVGSFYQRSWRQRGSLFLFTVLSVLGASGLVKGILNYVFYIDRPFVAQSFTPLVEQFATASFPSGHTTFFVTLATVVFLHMSAPWGIVAYATAGLIGLARVFAGVHYPLDIVGGIVIGITIPLIIRACIPALRPVREEEYLAPVEKSEQTL